MMEKALATMSVLALVQGLALELAIQWAVAKELMLEKAKVLKTVGALADLMELAMGPESAQE